MSFFEKNKYLFIGLFVSLLLHISIFTAFTFLKPTRPPEKEEKPIYITIVKKSQDTTQKKKLPSPKRTSLLSYIPEPVLPIPEKKILKKIKQKRKVEKKKFKKVKKRKKVIKLKKKKNLLKKEKIKKEAKKNKKIAKEKKKIIKKTMETFHKKDIKKTQNNTFNVAKPVKQEKNTKKTLSLADLKGKNSIFETGKKDTKKEKEKTDKDILAYIKALERYLNNLARRKDLYPPMAKRLRLEGSLTVRFTIRKNGTVDEKSIKVMVSSGYSILDKGAVKLIKKYVPLFAKKEGKKPPIDNLTVELPVIFEIINW